MDRYTEHSHEALEQALAFSSKDWSLNKTDAWIYGIVLGWDEPSFRELKVSLGWSTEAIERLKRLHADFKSKKNAHKMHTDFLGKKKT